MNSVTSKGIPISSSRARVEMFRRAQASEVSRLGNIIAIFSGSSYDLVLLIVSDCTRCMKASILVRSSGIISCSSGSRKYPRSCAPA